MNNCVYKTSFLFTHFLPSRHTAFYPLSKEFPKSEKHTVEPLCNGHLADRRKWPLWRGWNKSECMTVCPKKLPLWRGGPLVDWFNCTWITIKLGPFPSFFERQRQRDTVQPPSTFSWFRVLILLDLSSPLYPASSGCSWQECYATKGEKPLPATVCFSIKQACPHDAYIKMSNDIDHLSFSSFARNISKTTTSQMHHTFLYTCLLFLHDYHIKIPYFVVYGERKLIREHS